MTYRSNLYIASEIKYDQVDRNVRGSVLVNKLVYFGCWEGERDCWFPVKKYKRMTLCSAVRAVNRMCQY